MKESKLIEMKNKVEVTNKSSSTTYNTNYSLQEN